MRAQWRGSVGGGVLGAALGILAAFFGDVRAPVGLLIGLVLVGALVGEWPPAWRALRLGAGALALGLWLCLLTPVLRAPLAALTLAQGPQPADAIVVLGAGCSAAPAPWSPAASAAWCGGWNCGGRATRPWSPCPNSPG
ncbi:hypothetical protein [Deinococcus multiflagellatus]|uniref:Uncharacterized protein n=1 Tax=Deinococcus multiflagellatus TaxID=1656887 RepID=A0ABW1ZDT0_9DEIO